jgi:hypothetical protein
MTDAAIRAATWALRGLLAGAVVGLLLAVARGAL